MDDTKKQQLFPYFAYLYSQQLNPEKYGQANSIEEWTQLIQDSPEDIEKITAAAGELQDEDWDSLEQQYADAQENSAQFAKKGAKLKKLQQFGKKKTPNEDVAVAKKDGGVVMRPSGMANLNKPQPKPIIPTDKYKEKGGVVKKGKKCSCGCDLITVKEKGGKLVDKCACGCSSKKTKKHQQGGLITTYQKPASVIVKKKPDGMSTKDWIKTGAAGALATTSLNYYLPIAQQALSSGQLAIGAGQSMLPAVVPGTELATTTGGTAAGGMGLGTLLAIPAATFGGAYLYARQEAADRDARTAYDLQHGFGSGNIYNPRTRRWVEGTRDNFYNQRAATYETQPFSTTMNQRRSELPVTGAWDKGTREGHKAWNEKTQATATRQRFLNTFGPSYNLPITNTWDNATRQADKNYTTEILKPDIIQENDATRLKVVPGMRQMPIQRQTTSQKSNSNTPATNNNYKRYIVGTPEWKKAHWMADAPTTAQTTKRSTEASPSPKSNEKISVYDYLTQIGQDGSYNNRKQLAAKLGIQNYSGTADQNLKLLNLLKTQKPKFKQGGKVLKNQKGKTINDTDETWEPGDLEGLNKNQNGSMNPRDWSNERKTTTSTTKNAVTKKPIVKPKDIKKPLPAKACGGKVKPKLVKKKETKK